MQSRKIVVAFAMTASVLFASTNVWAEAVLLPGLTFTGRTGHNGPYVTSIGDPSGDKAVTFIVSEERTNAPCELRVTKRDINGGSSASTDAWSNCTPNEPSKSAGFTSGTDLFVYGIEACSTGSGLLRMKGIRVYGGYVGSDGTVVQLGAVDWFERANCANWHPPVFCPVGQVASKVRVHRDAGSIRGLSLGCRAVAEL